MCYVMMLIDCDMMSAGVVLPSMVPIDEAFIAGASSVLCHDGREYVLQQFEREDPRQLYYRQARAGAPPPSPSPPSASAGDAKEYPYLAAEILGNTILADIEWLEAFVAHHWYSPSLCSHV